MSDPIKITLTPQQAHVLFGVIDGAADAGACKDGLEPYESDALNDIMHKLLRHHAKWKGAV